MELSYGDASSKVFLIPAVLLAFWALFLFSGKTKKLPPSPPGYPIIGHLGLLGKLLHQDLQRIAHKHGPLVLLRLGLYPTLVVSSPEMAMEFLRIHDRNFASRPTSAAVRLLLYNQLSIGFSDYGNHWKKMRTLLTFQILTPKRLHETQHIRSEEMTSTLRIVERGSMQGAVINLTKIISAMSINVVRRVVLGKKYFGENTDQAAHLYGLLHQIFVYVGTVYVADYLPFLWWLDLKGVKGKMKKLHADLDQFLDNVIEEQKQKRKQKQGNSGHILDALLDLSEEGMDITPDKIKAVILNVLIGATDTVTSTVEWALSELLQAPSILQKAQEEIDQTAKITNGLVEESSLENLRYLKAIVNETLRLHPVAPLLAQHKAIEECKVGGYDIEKGIRVMVNVWAIGRDPKVWDRPLQFDPDRFINSSIDVKGQDFQLLPFGSGRRACPAITMGLTMVEFTLANLLYAFNWSVPNEKKLDMDEACGLILSRSNPLYAMASPRFHIT